MGGEFLFPPKFVQALRLFAGNGVQLFENKEKIRKKAEARGKILEIHFRIDYIYFHYFWTNRGCNFSQPGMWRMRMVPAGCRDWIESRSEHYGEKEGTQLGDLVVGVV